MGGVVVTVPDARGVAVGNRKSLTSDRDWWLGAWDWASMVEQQSGGRVQVSLKPGAQRGVWSVEVRIMRLQGDGDWLKIASVPGQWPNAQQNDLGAYVMNLTIEMDRMSVGSAEELLRDLA